MEKVKIEKIVFGGQGLAHHHDGRPIFVWNALPGEEVEVLINKKRRGTIEAVATNILTPSKERIAAEEEHFLSCSPWQMMTNEAEDRYKLQVAKEVYAKIGGFDLPDLSIFSDFNHSYGYRNKMEFSFWWDNEKENLSLALFRRGTKGKHSLDGCELAKPVINVIGQKIVDWLNEHKIEGRQLKTVIIRANEAGEGVAALFVKEKLEFPKYPELDDKFLGFQIYYSNPKSPASVPTELIFSKGQNFLIEQVLDSKLKYGLLSFFQVNVPIFESALLTMKPYIEDKDFVDYYAGVGAIGISLTENNSCILIESNSEAVEFASENIDENSVDCEAILSPSEDMLSKISSDNPIIFDPPRAGLHDKIIDKIKQKKPPIILYLSCNLSTQARDAGQLLDDYQIIESKLFNFFPRTPHVEGLLVLSRKS